MHEFNDPNNSLQRKIAKFLTSKRIIESALVKIIIRLGKRNRKLSAFIAREALRASEKHELQLLSQLIRPGMTVLDIGANFGTNTYVASKAVGETGKVFAFEPDPYNYQGLTDYIKSEKLTYVIPMNLALSNKQGQTNLYLDDINIGNHSLVQENLYTGKTHVKVNTDTLDNLKEQIGEVDFICIDVQGAEPLVFEGAKQMLIENQKLTIFMEFWPSGIKRMGFDSFEFIKTFYSTGFDIKMHDKRKLSESLKFEDVKSMVTSWDDPSNYANLIMTRS